MKVISSISVIVLLLIVASSFTVSNKTRVINQTTVSAVSVAASPFSYVRAHRQNKGILVSWAASGNVAGYVVEKTYQDPSDEYSTWEEVSYSISPSGQGKKVYDASVFPGYIHYRVGAVMQNGAVSYSDVVTVRIAAH